MDDPQKGWVKMKKALKKYECELVQGSSGGKMVRTAGWCITFTSMGSVGHPFLRRPCPRPPPPSSPVITRHHWSKTDDDSNVGWRMFHIPAPVGIAPKHYQGGQIALHNCDQTLDPVKHWWHLFSQLRWGSLQKLLEAWGKYWVVLVCVSLLQMQPVRGSFIKWRLLMPSA